MLNPHQLRLGFMGSSTFAVVILNHLLEVGIRPVVIYTQPPRMRGRGMYIRSTAVAECAREAGLTIISPMSLDSDAARLEFESHALDVAVVVSYGMKLSSSFLDAPRFGCINVHPSLLPRWRGAAPVERAIEAGDSEGGVSIMQMDRGIDTGALLHQECMPIPDDITGGEWHDLAASRGAECLFSVLERLEEIQPRPQSSIGVCHARMFNKASLELDFTQPAAVIVNKIRAFAPKPGTWCLWNERRLRLFSAKVFAHNVSESALSGLVLDDALTICTASGAIRPTVVQLEGRKVMDCKDFLLGTPIPPGTILGRIMS